MPKKNCLKEYEENGYYHVYNRGVEKRKIFLDEQDYAVFLSYLKFYLSPPDDDSTIFSSNKLKNYYGLVDLLCYCLMPNHFHLLIRQTDLMVMAELMRSLLTRYSKYFNKKYRRVGSLFESRYKAVQVLTEEQLVYLSKYIHRNPIGLFPATSKTVFQEMRGYRYTSLGNFLGEIKQAWVRCEVLTNLFSMKVKNLTYESFVSDSEFPSSLESIAIDDLEDCLP